MKYDPGDLRLRNWPVEQADSEGRSTEFKKLQRSRNRTGTLSIFFGGLVFIGTLELIGLTDEPWWPDWLQVNFFTGIIGLWLIVNGLYRLVTPQHDEPDSLPEPDSRAAPNLDSSLGKIRTMQAEFSYMYQIPQW